MVEYDNNLDGVRDQRLWPTFDANYNVTALLTDQGVTVERYAYTPYGERIIINGDQNYANTANDPDGTEWTVDTNGSDFGFVVGFQGLRFDGETGSWYQRARYTNSGLGVFEARDPFGYGSSMNVFSFLDQNTLIYIDPFGEAKHWNHDYPQDVFKPEVLKALGLPDFDIDALENGTLLEDKDHVSGPDAIHKGKGSGGDYNTIWREKIKEKLDKHQKMSAEELRKMKTDIQSEPRFKEQFSRGETPKTRYRGRPAVAKTIAVLSGIATLIATGETAVGLTGSFGDPTTASGRWFMNAVDPNYCDCGSLSEGNVVTNMRQEVLRQLRGAGGAAYAEQVLVEDSLTALTNFARDHCYARQGSGK